MSKHNLISLAIAAILASPAAFAVDVTPATPDIFPTNALTSNTVVVSNGAPITIAAAADDNYLGRTTGYNIRVTLSNGAKFAAAVVPATGLNGEVVTIAGGGTVGSTSVTYSVVPATGVVQGDGILIGTGDFVINTVGFMANGTPLTIDVRVGDPVGGGQLALTSGTTIASAVQAWDVTYTAPLNGDIRIDVGAASGKKVFSSTGAVNLADTEYYNAGSVTVALDPTITNYLGMDTSVATAPLIITGANLAPFKGAGGFVSVQSTSACDYTGSTIYATVAVTNLTASIPIATTVDALNTNQYICFDANATTIILAQDIGATLTVKQTGYTPSPAFTDAGGVLLDMAYNGAVKYVWHFNPSSNIAQESYLRITNSSSTSGLFTIDSVCDDGSAGLPVSFTQGAGKSILLTSKDIELGNTTKGLTGAAGTCTANSAVGITAKRRLTVTGEVGSLEVQGFLRNRTSAGDVNTNVNDKD